MLSPKKILAALYGALLVSKGGEAQRPFDGGMVNPNNLHGFGWDGPHNDLANPQTNDPEQRMCDAAKDVRNCLAPALQKLKWDTKDAIRLLETFITNSRHTYSEVGAQVHIILAALYYNSGETTKADDHVIDAIRAGGNYNYAIISNQISSHRLDPAKMLEDIVSSSTNNKPKFFKQEPKNQRELKKEAKEGIPEAQLLRAAKEYQNGKQKAGDKLLDKATKNNPEYENIAIQIREGNMTMDEVEAVLRKTQQLAM